MLSAIRQEIEGKHPKGVYFGHTTKINMLDDITDITKSLVLIRQYEEIGRFPKEYFIVW